VNSTSGLVILGMLLLCASCHRAVPGSRAAGMFAGTAAPVSPQEVGTDECTVGVRQHSEEHLDVVSCWRGTLNGKPFVLSQSANAEGARVTIEYDDREIADRPLASNSPVLIRFAGSNVCFAEKAGSRYEALNIETGASLSDDQAQEICPPDRWPPDYVLGLRTKNAIQWSRMKP
jgi:hypothetical protein